MPNIDPRAMKNLMSKMGMRSTEISADRVTIETADKSIVIESPQVTKIEMQGSTSFQVSGNITETDRLARADISESDIDFVAEKAGVKDRAAVKSALEKENGDIAKAILDLASAT